MLAAVVGASLRHRALVVVGTLATAGAMSGVAVWPTTVGGLGVGMSLMCISGTPPGIELLRHGERDQERLHDARAAE